MALKTVSTENAKNIAVVDLFKELSASRAGLSTSEVKARLEKYGPNEIPEKKVSPFVKFLSYFWGPIPWMIEAAAALSLTIRRFEDFAIIFALLLLNAVVGFWQGYQASNAIELLKERLAIEARVRRDGEWRDSPARELVPGDVIYIRLGDIVPADIKLIDEGFLLVDESALTGESLPVEKHLSDVAYSGSIIKQGEMNALVVTTGAATYFGKTTRLVEEAKTQSHFQRAVIKIGDYLIALAIALVTIIFIVSIFRGTSLLQTLQFALVLTVAAIPVALPAVLTISMAVGATALAKKEAIVSRLVAIEEMAGMDILCSDKTGTITENELTVATVEPFGSSKSSDVLLFSYLASREEAHDPIDDAVIAKAKTVEETTKEIPSFKILTFKPFDPVSKYAEATVEDATGANFKVVKGAPQVILALATESKAISSEINAHINAMAAKGYRALGVAKTDIQEGWHFAGLIALYDPPREDSAETIRVARSMGVDVKMVTGDHIAIAKEVAQEVGLGTNIVTASQFLNTSDRTAEGVVESADGFAQVFPEHKYKIVELLQYKGHIAGMTGDGVNDAPALKKADTGIAVAGATDAAKSAADIVLTKPGLSVIIDSIKESRKIFQRMTNYSIYRITETIRVLFFITLSIIIFRFFPITALMIVLLALLNDAPVITIAYDNVKYSNEPEKWNMLTLLSIATFLGFVGVISSFGILYIGREVFGLTLSALQSFIYLKLSVAGHLTLLVARTRGPFWSVTPAPQLLAAVITTQLIATLIVVYGILLSPIGWPLALFVWGYALAAFFITDFLKIRFYRLIDHRGLRFFR
ncbi:MAG TPA: plasma-membrane proton-efflux P-type ATPase [Anaerolineae bacterium]|nr:plasma-membrane proton-efflux P-type ATPase [Anaerolineae bacterium]